MCGTSGGLVVFFLSGGVSVFIINGKCHEVDNDELVNVHLKSCYLFSVWIWTNDAIENYATISATKSIHKSSKRIIPNKINTLCQCVLFWYMSTYDWEIYMCQAVKIIGYFSSIPIMFQKFSTLKDWQRILNTFPHILFSVLH